MRCRFGAVFVPFYPQKRTKEMCYYYNARQQRTESDSDANETIRGESNGSRPFF